MLTDSEFRQKCDEAISALYLRLSEAADDYDFDVEMNAGALSIEFEEPRERFVVSPNAPVRQIWVSAHVQSFKLDWDGTRGAFAMPGGGQTLEELMVSAIQKRIPEFSLQAN